MARSRFIEAEDSRRTNHGKFLLVAPDACDRAYVSTITRAPLLASLPPVRRLGGAIGASALWLLDLQTQEGSVFDPTWTAAELRRRFLCHPLHVCILYFPVMLHLARHADAIWTLPALITLPTEEACAQPGVLLDARGVQVRTFAEWSARTPLVARLRNREVPREEDGQDALTPDERARGGVGERPVW